MKIAIIGTGYVGLVSGACFAEMGTEVVCIDKDEQKIENLKQGVIPIYEPGLEEMALRNIKAKRLSFSTDLKSNLNEVEIVFCAVGTPPKKDGSTDLNDVLAVAETVGKHIENYILFVNKSTVPVGTAGLVKQTIQSELIKRNVHIPFDVASNPEFLKEGAAVKDFMSPDRVVVGTDSEKAKNLMSKLYRPFLLNNFRVIFMDILSAEMTKYAANAMLATRISFMNDMANLCEIVGADVNWVRKGIGSDTRIGSKFLYPGCGYGGSCFPKDIKSLIKTAESKGYQMTLLKAVETVNDAQKLVLFRKLSKHFNGNIQGKKIAVWGLAFKPETDDIREAPALLLIDRILKSGGSVSAYDPVAMEETKKYLGNLIHYGTDIYDTATDADAIIIVTEWKEFRLPSWNAVKKLMRDFVILDGRNIYEKSDIEEAGFIYYGIGR